MRTPVTAHSVADLSRLSKMVASFLVATYAVVTILPLLWIFLTGFKTPPDSIAYPPKILFEPSVEGYVNLFTTRSRQTPEFLASLPPPQTWYERLVRSRNMVIGGPSKVVARFVNSIMENPGAAASSSSRQPLLQPKWSTRSPPISANAGAARPSC